MGGLTASEELEVQGRACEYGRTFRHEAIRSQLFEHMPALDEATYSRRVPTPYALRSHKKALKEAPGSWRASKASGSKSLGRTPMKPRESYAYRMPYKSYVTILRP